MLLGNTFDRRTVGTVVPGDKGVADGRIGAGIRCINQQHALSDDTYARDLVIGDRHMIKRSSRRLDPDAAAAAA